MIYKKSLFHQRNTFHKNKAYSCCRLSNIPRNTRWHPWCRLSCCYPVYTRWHKRNTYRLSYHSWNSSQYRFFSVARTTAQIIPAFALSTASWGRTICAIIGTQRNTAAAVGIFFCRIPRNTRDVITIINALVIYASFVSGTVTVLLTFSFL